MEMFNTFNIIKTLWNYFTCEFLPYYLSTKVVFYV